ncbi:DUF2628 domain-containing protein [Fusibacter bizertensis]
MQEKNGLHTEKNDFEPSPIYEEYSRDREKSKEEDLIREFVGPNYDFYLRKFKVQDVSESNLTWNWPAFWVTPLWLAYRKLYVHAAVILVISTLLRFMGGFGTLIGLGISIFVGLNGNAFYRNYVENHIENIKGLLYEERQLYNKENGGTNSGAVWLLIAASIIVTALINTLN